MSAKMKWYEQRMEYLTEIQKSMTKKITDTRVQSMNFITDLINFNHKYYGEKIEQYMATGDRAVVDNIDMKALTQYFKSIEVLEKILNPANVTPRGSGSAATININASGADVQMDGDTVDITPGNQGDILKALAKLKDAQKNKDKQ